MKSLRRHREDTSALDASVPAVVGVSTLAVPTRLDVHDALLRDELTDLGSLFALRDRLEGLVNQYPPFGPRPALLLVDLDGFGRINQDYGEAMGDQVLAASAARLRWAAGEAASIYRSAGDEFVAILEPATSIEAVDRAGQIQKVLSQPVEVDGYSVAVTASIAVVMLGHRRRADGLLRDADVTMYRAKAEGGDRVDVYNWEIDSWSTARRRDLERLSNEVEELRLQNRVFAEAMTIDTVTGLHNALAFDADQLQIHARWKRSSEPYSVLRARIDDLEDLRRHSGLDDRTTAMVAVAEAIRETIRQTDRGYLLGEGEFAVLLPGCRMQQAIRAGERVRTSVEKLELGHPGDSSRHVTVTVAATEAGFRHTDMKDVMIELEDVLRAALGSGRSRVIWPR